ncbi:helix-turn-helix domain-containing protein [Streptomyces kronopolitis]|uniref:helix-turn-helix domain-containing protein n=1 Tax=Streptomyces kronopolitis TaxID=1612435 RepID=UPI00369B5B6B
MPDQALLDALPKIVKHRKLTGDERVDVLKRLATAYLGGWAVRTLSERCGRSFGTVHNMLIEANVPLRRRGGDTRGPDNHRRVSGGPEPRFARAPEAAPRTLPTRRSDRLAPSPPGRTPGKR